MRIAIILLLVGLCGADEAIADWTIKLPEPRPIEIRPGLVPETEVSAFGFWLSFLEPSPGYRSVWISPMGALLLDHTVLNASSRPIIAMLGTNKCVLMFSKKDTPEQRTIRFIQTTENSEPQIQDFEYAESGYELAFVDAFPRGSKITPDTDGFYLFRATEWTLSRIVFQKAAPASANPLVLQIQSSATPTGPWAVVEEVKVPTGTPSSFFRLEAKRQ